MFKSLFTPKWKHQDPKVRQEALANLNAEQDASIISQMATSDESIEIRRSALAKIKDQQTLQPILLQANTPSSWCMVASHLADLVPENIDALTVQFNHKKNTWDQQAVTNAITKCDNASLAESLLLSSDNYQALLKAATSAKSIELRLSIVDKLDDLQSLQQLQKQASHKQVIHAVKEKIKNIKAKQQNIDETLQHAEKITQNLSKLANQTWDTQFAAKVQLLTQQWQSLEIEVIGDSQVIEAKTSEYNHALSQCQATIDSWREEAEKAAQAQEAKEKQLELCDQLQNLIQEIQSESLQSCESLREGLILLDKNWQQIASDVEPDPQLKGRFNGLRETLNHYFATWEKFESLSQDFIDLAEQEHEETFNDLTQWLKRWNGLNKKLNWPNELSTPAALKQWQEQAKSLRQKHQTLEAGQKKKAAQLNHKLKTLEKHIRQRNLIAANKLANYINFELKELAGDFLSGVTRRLENLEPDLNELRDWHAFATTPKKESLCEAMQQLGENPEEPLAQAEKVHQLQEQWRELISSDATADQALWDRFKQAADKAYQPCLAYYAEQDQVKAGNLQQKITICEQLEKQLNDIERQKTESENIDLPSESWKALDNTYRQITKEWKQHEPIPNNERKSIQKRFNASLNSLKELLHAEKQANLDARIELVTKAEKLISFEDNLKAIETSKRLQQEWKTLGLTFFKADREQWQKFREASDQVFAKRDELKQAFKNELKTNEQTIKEITSQIIALSKLDDDSLKQKFDEFEALCQQWDRQAELPRNHAKKVIADFDKACQNFKERYAGIGERQLKRNLVGLKEGTLILQQAEEALLGEQKISLEAIDEQLNNLPCDDKGKSIVELRLQQLTNAASESEVSKNQTGVAELEHLALTAEILSETESPESFKTQRMELQLKQLQDGLSGRTSQEMKHQQILEIFYQWASIGFIPASNRASLNERFDKVFISIDL